MKRLARQQVFKDPIYGYIHVDYEIIKKLIDTSLFQRLRRIRQLSGVQMVFHGAEHSRFSHSLGVYELAYRFLTVKELKESLDERSQLLFMTAALLHDIGHGAYSHAFEQVFKVNHEHIGAKMILEHAEIKNILDQVDKQFAKDIANIILKKGNHVLIEQLISSQIDIDRLDYLERDAYFTGAAYGHIDLDRLMRVLNIRNGKAVFSISGIHAIENYLISRYHMYWQVYYHPVARAYETILDKIYLRVKDLCLEDFKFNADIEPLKKLIQNPNDLDNFIRIDDFFVNGLISSFTLSKDDILKTLSKDFLNRHIWKYLNDTKDNQEEIEKIKSTYDPKLLKYFTAHKTVSNSTYLDEAKDIGDQVEILLKDGTISTLKDESQIIKGLILTGVKEDPEILLPKNMRPKVFVVEGRNDFSRLKQLYPDMFILTTNGSAITESTVEALIKLDETHDIVLFLDPDYAGERIRKMLASKLTHVYHAFIDQKKAFSKNHQKIGIEHASKDDLNEALDHLQMRDDESISDIDMIFLYENNLLGKQNSKSLRDMLAKKLHLGHVNGKTLLNRLRYFNVEKQEVLEVLSCNINPKKDLVKIS